jgi:hypothetical protein
MGSILPKNGISGSGIAEMRGDISRIARIGTGLPTSSPTPDAAIFLAA